MPDTTDTPVELYEGLDASTGLESPPERRFDRLLDRLGELAIAKSNSRIDRALAWAQDVADEHVIERMLTVTSKVYANPKVRRLGEWMMSFADQYEEPFPPIGSDHSTSYQPYRNSSIRLPDMQRMPTDELAAVSII